MIHEPHPDDWLRVDSMPTAGQPALFLDRDGTLIENVPYLADPDAIVLIKGAVETLRAFRQSGYAIVIVTNQSGIARGLCSPAQYRAVEARLQQVLADAAVDVVYASPFHPGAPGEFGRAHASRKPGAGMFRDAARRFGIDLAGSVMVGDSLSDIQAAAAADVGRLVHVQTGHGEAESASVRQFSAESGLCVEAASSLALIRPHVEAHTC